MPATEQTWRSTKKLHIVFGVTSVILLFSTVWMFVDDFTREWKQYTTEFRNVELKATNWREFQYAANEIEAEKERLSAKLKVIRGKGLDKGLLQQFKNWTTGAVDGVDPVAGAPSFDDFDENVAELDKLSSIATDAAKKLNAAQLDYDEAKLKSDDAGKKLEEALSLLDAAKAKAAADAAQQSVADEAARVVEVAQNAKEKADAALKEAVDALAVAKDASTIADEATAPVREEIVEFMESVITKAIFNEDIASGKRKGKMANLDRAVARLGIGVRDGLDAEEMQQRQAEVTRLKQETRELTKAWEDLKRQREHLRDLVGEMTEEEAQVLADMEATEADLETLEKAKANLRVNFFEGPLPGKRWLALPILEAFNSPLKIDNLWADGLEQTYGSFGTVRRFDRCTTCHRGMEKTMPGSATDPAYLNEHLLEMALSTEVGEDVDTTPPADADTDLKEKIAIVSKVYGLHFANEGLLNPDDVTVAYIRTQSLGAQAEVLGEVKHELLGEEIQERLLHLEKDRQELLPGLRVGDVVEQVNGGMITSAERLVYLLADSIGSGKTLNLTIRRGLEHPYSTHPRLDLFVGSLSPHKVTDFACTICHEGQGSATEFKWASHTPDTPEEKAEWTREYGWFDNHHWIYPMNPSRFVESVCLKCHHQVTDLRPSEQFPEAPAPKVVHGYDLIMKYGCYGCHEVNGYDGPKSVGPDLRAEPNFFAAALKLRSDPGFEDLAEETQSQANSLSQHPENNELRHELLRALKEDDTAEEPALTTEIRSSVIDLLADVDAPGDLRKPGPALRYFATKADPVFGYDWIRKPANFRPSTRMPQFFGHWSHLDDESQALSEKLEPMEIESALAYLMMSSQELEYLTPPEGITETTQQEQIERGKVLFEERGCLACHSHPDFPEMSEYRPEDSIQQGPDLGGLGSKFDPQRNPNGRKWLYSWIKEPTRYHARTVMPNLYLDPLEVKKGEETIKIDPADDIVEYLMSSKKEDWKPAARPDFSESSDLAALDDLVREHLRDAFITSEVEEVLAKGVAASREANLKDAEKVLLVSDAELATNQLSVETKLRYAGGKTIAKFGCYGCHDIPGFEAAKPIGAGLADWGRKDASKLAFEHIHEYLHQHGHGHGAHDGDHELTFEEAAKLAENPYLEDAGESHDEHDEHDDGFGERDKQQYPPFFSMQMDAGNRTGFIYQKLREPRSYDYYKTRNKKYNDRLRMPLFPFSNEEREAVITFVLGLVADPPNNKYMYHPSEREEALIQGEHVLEKYNCKGCHMVNPQTWDLEFPAGAVGAQSAGTTYPFMIPDYTTAELAASQTPNERNKIAARVHGMPKLLDQGPARILDDGDLIEADETYNPERLDYTFEIWKPALVDGEIYIPGETPKSFKGPFVRSRHPADGGDLARYLIERVGARARQENGNAKVGEIWGWLPPPLHGEGKKVQTEWLHNFLLEPYMIRPAAVLRMPKFNMSPDEATKLVNYFAAKDHATYPYSYSERRDPSRLERLDRQYRADHGGEDGERLRDAMNIVTSPSYCIKCHDVEDAQTSAALRAQAPNLSQVYRRLRPEYLRRWIAKPNGILPYTAMPVNVPYNPDKPFLGSTVPQDLYHGTSVEQVDALVDLLMNYDQYARNESKIAPLVKAAADKAAAKAAAEKEAAEKAAAEAAAQAAAESNGASDSATDE